MKLLFVLLLLTVTIFLVSCNYCELWGATSLGNNFSLVESDEKHVAIDYCVSKCCDSGIPIVPANITEYNFDTKWIVAKSENSTGSTYWVIDKNFKTKFGYGSDMREKILSNVLGPLDSVEFIKKIKQNHIDLAFKKYKSLQ